MSMQIHKQVDIQVSAQKTWEEVWTGFPDIGQWSSAVFKSEGQVGHGRVCQTSMGPFEENIVHSNPEKMVFTFEAKGEKMPFFVRSMKNTWKVHPLDDQNSRVYMRAEIDVMFPFSIFPGPIMKLNISRMLGQVLEELQLKLETGKLHERKLKSLKKNKSLATA